MIKTSLVSLALAAGLGIAATVAAQTAPAQATQPTATATASQSKSSTPEHQVLKPGDRNCLQSTGSLIPAKKGHCLPVNGRSYTREDLLRTGRQNTGQALRDLDPAIH